MGASAVRNVRPASGGDSILLLALQPRWGVPITDFTEFIQRRFPHTRNTTDVDAEFIQSDSTIGGGVAPPSILSRLTPDGQIEGEILPEDIVHYLRWAMNIQEDPKNSPFAEKVIAAAAAVSGYATGMDVSVDPDWPSKVKITFGGSATMSDGSDITIVGTGRRGVTATEPVRETIELTAGAIADGTEYTSVFTYEDVTSITIPGITGTSATIAADYVQDSNRVPLALGSLSDGLVAMTGQMGKGPTPVVAQNMVVSNATITMGQNVRILLDIIASTVLNNRLAGNLDEETDSFETTGSDPVSATSPGNVLANFPYSNLNFARNWGTAVTMGQVGAKEVTSDDDAKLFTTNNVVVGINNNLTESTGNTGNPQSGQPIVGDAGRQITVQVEKQYETGADAYDWQSIFRSSATLPIRVRSFNFDSTGRTYLVQFDLGGCKLSASPRIATEGRGGIPQTLDFEATTLSVRVVSEHGFSNGSGQ